MLACQGIGMLACRGSVAAVRLGTVPNRFGSASRTDGSVRVQHIPENVELVLSWFEPIFNRYVR